MASLNFFFFQAEDGIRDHCVTGVQTCALPISSSKAVLIDVGSEEAAEFRQTLLDVYVPRYGAEWERFLDSGPVYARIEAERMFAFATLARSEERRVGKGVDLGGCRVIKKKDMR